LGVTNGIKSKVMTIEFSICTGFVRDDLVLVHTHYGCLLLGMTSLHLWLSSFFLGLY